MWIMTKQGFISAVQHRDEPNCIMIRARKREHLLQVVDDRHIQVITPSDYPYRCTIDRAEFIKLIEYQINDIDYDNFKNAVPDHGYHRFLSDVWQAGYTYQMRLEAPANNVWSQYDYPEQEQ